jgi:HNH endonuclease
MTTRPTAGLRRQVVERAGNCCEYCLLHQELAASTHQVDHVIAEKHGGQTVLDNLALSCMVCNRRKGSDISSIDPETGNLVSLFNPRTQQWPDHFELDGVHIVGLTDVGRTTVVFLQLNAFERLMERDALIRAGRYPPQRMTR